MEEKVEYMLRIIDEDGESFASRAEMYYRRRPELVNHVEDSFRGYRALAERYDHLSRDLQSANRTIATVCPERVQLEMDDEDEENIPITSAPAEPQTPSKNLPDVPPLSIPKLLVKSSKAPSRLKSKKGLLKRNVSSLIPTGSGLSKAEALQEIDKLQKKILAFQTEKEFVRSSYESRLAKYWEIEEQVTEMQANVSSLQDEFGIGAVIEDDEARNLMVTTALKSCRETMSRLQEKRKQTSDEASEEIQRIEEAYEKFEALKKRVSSSLNRQGISEKHEQVSKGPELKNVDQQSDGTGHVIHDLELLQAKIKEQLQENSAASFTMSELAEKIDELVEKVITLETAVSSQTALVGRLKAEANEFEKHLNGLEEDKEALVEGSERLINRIGELERGLHMFQHLKQNVNDQDKILQLQFTEVSCNLDHLSDKLNSLKPDEEAQDMVLFTEPRAASGSKLVKTKEEKKATSGVEQNMSAKAAQHATSEEASKGNEQTMAPPRGSVISKLVRYGEEVKRGEIPDESTSAKVEKRNFVPSERRGLLVQGQVRGVPDVRTGKGSRKNEDTHVSLTAEGARMERNLGESGRRTPFDKPPVTDQMRVFSNSSPGKELREHVDIMASGQESHDSASRRDGVMEKEGKKKGFPDCNIVKTEKEARTVLAASTLFNSKVAKREEKERKTIVSGHGASVEVEELNSVQGYQSSHFNDTSREVPVKTFPGSDRERKIKDGEKMMVPGHNPMIPKDLKIEEEKNDDFFDCEPENCVKESEDIVAPGNDSLSSKDARTEEGENKNCILDESTHIKAKEKIHYACSNPCNHCGLSGYHEPNKRQGFLTLENDIDLQPKELWSEEEDTPNWRQMFSNDLDDKEKILLEEYTSILRNYKQVKKNLHEVEKQSHDCLFKSAMKIKDLKMSNALKDMEIQSLHKKLKLLQVNHDVTPETSSADFNGSQQGGPHESIAKGNSSQALGISHPNSDQKEVSDLLHEQNVECIGRVEVSTATERVNSSPRKGQEVKSMISIDEPQVVSFIEEKFRMDIDGLLEENMEFWLRFSTSFNQIQKFKNSVRDLQSELTNLRENKNFDGPSKDQSLNSDVRPIYRHLREIHTELAVWLEHNSLLKDDLQNRLSALCNIQEEIARLLNAGSETEETETSNYQAAKFQGEVLNMKQENNKIAEELEAGLEHVKRLQIEVESTLLNLEEQLGISGSTIGQSQKKMQYHTTRSRIPLRTFLFGVKLKKQKQKHSIFACMNPSSQKQYNDLSELPL